MTSGTDSFAFRQNGIHGGAPIVTFSSETKQCHFCGDVILPGQYTSSSADAKFNNYYTRAESDALFANIDLSNYYNKAEIDAIDDELTSLILNTCTKTEVDNLLTGSENIDITNNTISLTYPLK